MAEFEPIKVIAFDADDTLWENENFFRDAEQEFYILMKDFAEEDELKKLLFEKEVGQLSLYGYGIKSFILSMIETALELSHNQVSGQILGEIIDIGKKMLTQPVRLLQNVEDTLIYLKQKNYRLIVATKGDLLDQERKLKQSGLLHYFQHIEVMTEKKEENYLALLERLAVKPTEFLMIGNSIKSDIIPVLKIRGMAIQIPYHTTWDHENIDQSVSLDYQYLELESLGEIYKKNIL